MALKKQHSVYLLIGFLLDAVLIYGFFELFYLKSQINQLELNNKDFRSSLERLQKENSQLTSCNAELLNLLQGKYNTSNPISDNKSEIFSNFEILQFSDTIR